MGLIPEPLRETLQGDIAFPCDLADTRLCYCILPKPNAIKIGKTTISHTGELILSFFCFLCVFICLGVVGIPKYISCGIKHL